ncbi:MAG: SUMF1/EgtB/PvdO family nonheme iron enzyme [Planctomycetota bacterium]
MRRRTLVGIAALPASVLLGLAAWAALAEPAAVPTVGTDLARMVHVPAGNFLGAELGEYWIDRFEVTEADWARYAAETGARDPLRGLGERRANDYPVRHVDFDDALAFARWHRKDLPTNLEWERAARGEGDSILPWGSGYLPLANTAEAWERRGFVGQGVVRVGIFARGRSRFGAHDMVGNVREWTRSGFRDALRDSRFATDPQYDRDEGKLVALQRRLAAWPEFWVLRDETIPIESMDELRRDPAAALRDRIELIELLPVLTPNEELEYLRDTGFTIDREAQHVLASMRIEEVYLEDVVDDPLAYEAPDPRLLPVIDRAAIELLGEFEAEPRPEQFRLGDVEELTALDRDQILGVTRGRPSSVGLEIPAGLDELLPVLASEPARRLEELETLVDGRLRMIEDWKNQYPDVVRLRDAEIVGERYRLVRGGSFRTRIKGNYAALEDYENAGNSSWDLGFRCVVRSDEVARQRRILPLISELGWRDPWHVWRKVRPARRSLVEIGSEALPYLEQARARLEPGWLRERLDEVISDIEVRG